MTAIGTRKKRQAYAESVRVYLQTEAPFIGCGWRSVRVRKLGWKWAHIEEVATGKRARISTDAWRRLNEEPRS
jgi:hypothetical protein